MEENIAQFCGVTGASWVISTTVGIRPQISTDHGDGDAGWEMPSDSWTSTSGWTPRWMPTTLIRMLWTLWASVRLTRRRASSTLCSTSTGVCLLVAIDKRISFPYDMVRSRWRWYHHGGNHEALWGLGGEPWRRLCAIRNRVRIRLPADGWMEQERMDRRMENFGVRFLTLIACH